MSMDSSSMKHSSGSNSVIYSGGGAADGSAATGGGSGSFQGVGYGSNIGFVMPISTVIAHESSHGQGNGSFGDSKVKAIGYDNIFGSTDPYHARSLYYLSQQSSAGMVRGSSAYWVPALAPLTTWQYAMEHLHSQYGMIHKAWKKRLDMGEEVGGGWGAGKDVYITTDHFLILIFDFPFFLLYIFSK